jgi:hypothetical protein
LINEIHIPIEKSIRIEADNESAIALFKNSQYHARIKHINIAYHFQRYKVQKEVVKFIKIPSQDMVADGLTKLFPKIKFERFLHLIDMGEY